MTQEYLLISDDLQLRRLCDDDVVDLYEITSSENVAKYMRFNAHQSIDETREMIAKYKNENGFAIIIDDAIAGVFAFTLDNEKEYSTSVFIKEEFWGRGYVSKVVEFMLKFASETLQAKKLFAYIVEGNIGSRKVVEKFNFNVDKILHFDDLDGGLFVYSKEL